MTQLEKLETRLDDVFAKNPAIKLPVKSRKSLAEAMWWLALVAGILQLWLAWTFWHAGHWIEDVVSQTNTIAAYYGVHTTVHNLGMLYYITLVVLLASGVLSLLAAPGLKAMQKHGWNLLFYSLLVNVVYGFVRMFTDYGGLMSLIGALFGSAIAAYFLFQVREYFIKSASAHKSA